MVCERPDNLIMNSHLGIRPLLSVTVCDWIQVPAKEQKHHHWQQFQQILKIGIRIKSTFC